MVLAPLVLLTLTATSQRVAQSDWYHAEVDVPNVAAMQRLQDSDLVIMDCIPGLGTVDVAIGPGDASDLKNAGYRFRIVRQLEDPSNWRERHPRQQFDG